MMRVVLMCLLVSVIACQGKEKVECPVIGIDLGTTYSCVGIYKNGVVDIIPNELGNRITPSVVAFTDEETLAGEAAKNQASQNPTRTIYDVKRLIGRVYSDKSVQHDKKYLPYQLTSQNNNIKIQATVNQKNKIWVAEEISAMILNKMKDIAETYIGQTVKNVVITVPAYFNDAQRQATKDAGAISGLNVVRIINEPTAAAIAYGLDKKGEKNILVFDLGGGTFDVSVLTIENGVFQVVATHGDTHLGGEDFDQRVMDHFIKMIQKKQKIDISEDKRAMQKLKRKVEEAKRALSTVMETSVEIEGLVSGYDMNEQLSRAKFEQLNEDLFKKTMGPVAKALEESGFPKDKIDEIVLVGGSTRIPKVRQLVKNFFNGKEPNTGINPDEAIAYGAAVQGGIICGEQSQQELVVIDATPLSLGLEMEGGVYSKVIHKGTVIPAKRTKIFTTSHDYQTHVEFPVYEGERPMAKDNHKLDQFSLKGISPALAGEPQLETTFEIDANGILSVSAKDLGTGIQQKIVINNLRGRLSQEQIDQMIKEAEDNKEKDALTKKRINAIQGLKHYMDSVKNILKDMDKSKSNRISAEERETIDAAIKDATSWYEENESSAELMDIEAKQTELEDKCKNIMTNYYKKNNAFADDDKDEDDTHDEL